LAVALLVAADAPKKDAVTAQPKLWAVMSVSPPVLDWDTWVVDPDNRLMIYFGLVNDGAKIVDPDVDRSQLLINGKPLKEWGFIIGNGPRDDRWEALPPGDDLAFGSSMGKYFKEPGIYKLSWKGKAFQSPEVVFRVMPKDGK
jgi:hypothetical protein